MNRARIAVWLLIFAACLPVLASAASAKLSVGDKVSVGAMVDSRTGQSVALEQLAGPQGVVLVFVSTECPYSNAFNQVMAAVAREYKARGVAMIGINSNKTEPRDAVKRHADEKGLDFAVIKDEGSALANQLGATRTPEVFLLDKEMKLRYHGALGNSKTPTTKADQANADDLRQALEAVLSGNPVQVAETKAFGCTIKR